ncbi:DUF2029 domain-containing protein [Candidatus Collierbacteria bacterium]|nr:DUF2029 domain-containing protein [Candidatus Collierbacteria bacterium]
MKATILITALYVIIFSLLSATISFPDVFQLVFTPVRAAMEGISPYSYVDRYKEDCPWLDATYPPLFYRVITPYYLALLRLGVFGTLINEVCPVWPFITNGLILFLTKLPYLAAQIITALIFSRMFPTERLKWYVFYLFQPLPLFVGAMMGQFDGLMVLVVVVATYLLLRQQYLISALTFGIAGAIKHQPFLVAVPLLWRWKEVSVRKLLATILLAVPYLAALWKSDVGEVQRRVFGFSENTKMMSAKIDLGLGVEIPIFVILYLVSCWLVWRRKSEDVTGLERVTRIGLLSLLPYYLVTPWFLQRILIVVPYLILFGAAYKSGFRLLYLINWLFFVWAIFGYPGVLDSVLLRGLWPKADYVLPLAARLSSVTAISVKDLGKYSLTGINSVLLILYILAGWHRQDKKLYLPNRRDFVLLGMPLVGYLAVISLNLLQ